jgi:hypothetical protein
MARIWNPSTYKFEEDNSLNLSRGSSNPNIMQSYNGLMPKNDISSIIPLPPKITIKIEPSISSRIADYFYRRQNDPWLNQQAKEDNALAQSIYNVSIRNR